VAIFLRKKGGRLEKGNIHPRTLRQKVMRHQEVTEFRGKGVEKDIYNPEKQKEKIGDPLRLAVKKES